MIERAYFAKLERSPQSPARRAQALTSRRSSTAQVALKLSAPQIRNHLPYRMLQHARRNKICKLERSSLAFTRRPERELECEKQK